MSNFKKTFIGFTVLIAVLCLTQIIIEAATPTVEGQIQSQWELLRTEADEDSSTIDLTSEGDFDNMPSGAEELKDDGTGIGTNRKIDIITCAGSAANKTYTITYYGWKKANGPAQRIMSVAYTTGTQAVVKYPHTKATATNKFWADTAVVTPYRSVTVADNDCNGNNGVAELTVYSGGFNYIYGEVSGADGATGAEAGDVSIYYSVRN